MHAWLNLLLSGCHYYLVFGESLNQVADRCTRAAIIIMMMMMNDIGIVKLIQR